MMPFMSGNSTANEVGDNGLQSKSRNQIKPKNLQKGGLNSNDQI